MLCLKCQECLQKEPSPTLTSQSLAHHPTYQSLEKSIDEGCYVCSRFWESLSAQEQDLISSTSVGPEMVEDGFSTSASLDDGKYYGHPGCYLFQVAYNLSPVDTLPTGFWRGSFLVEPAKDNVSLSSKSLAQSTGSQETLSLAKRWVQQCTTRHERCSKPAEEKPWYPTRLLSFNLHEAPTVRLIETARTRPDGQYMTLTHRWGPSPADHIVLTKDTYPQLLEGAPLSALPQVFQDAISICCHLEICHIWIDSLCIFQGTDNAQDWQREASLMKDVYSNSFCNISAADAPDPSQSIFSHRDPHTLIPQVVARSCKEGAETPECFILSDDRFWQKDVSNALVNKRAWVLQERFLAPRILHFGKRQLIWECCEKDAAEVYPDGLPASLSTSPDAAFKQLDSSEYISRVTRYWGREGDGNSAPHLLWVRIVELYTASALTVPSDKLIACSGIVKRVAEIIQDDYVAGMWRRYLEGELLWVAQFNHQPGRCTRPREYRAPTWSWASVDGPITPGEPRIQDSLITVQDYHLDYWTDDKTAAIRGGWLRLRGVLRKATLERKAAEGYYWDMSLDGEKFNTQEETSPANCEPRVMLDILQEDFDQENAQGLLFCMCARSKNEDGRGMYILVLKMVQGETGTFQRIGLAYAWSTKVKERVLMRSPGEAQLPCLEYRNGLHSIRII
ncbi:hypothetical protein CDV36_007607 [Fusarium kuroshium]|uniref:Heterokaryon incompatibility domain-containing protein n=1 Tax=Fusarium kuroshium TaxID=2010991 RepID=A0A3M2S568_9HYPO|nr:hypothetical protein CDV36_007607 [Fusarium kuroshium]